MRRGAPGTACRVPDAGLSRHHGSARPRYFAAKRCVDLAGACVLLVLASPLLVVIPIVIRLDSRGPALFHQERMRGRRVDGGASWAIEPFRLHKFRTMVADADPALHRTYIEAYMARDEAVLRALRPDRGEDESFRPGATRGSPGSARC